MSAHAAKGRLAEGFKRLVLAWQATKADWQDDQSQRIEQQLLLPLERQIKQTANALDIAGSSIASAKMDCRAGE